MADFKKQFQSYAQHNFVVNEATNAWGLLSTKKPSAEEYAKKQIAIINAYTEGQFLNDPALKRAQAKLVITVYQNSLTEKEEFKIPVKEALKSIRADLEGNYSYLLLKPLKESKSPTSGKAVREFGNSLEKDALPPHQAKESKRLSAGTILKALNTPFSRKNPSSENHLDNLPKVHVR